LTDGEERLLTTRIRVSAPHRHWFFLGQTTKPADEVINADPDAWYTSTAEQMGEEAWTDYLDAIHNPETVRAMCEDYHAGLGIDRAHDDADRRAGRRVTCATLLLWAAKDDLEDLYGDPLEIWQAWADDLRGHSLDSGHHLAEEIPEELAAEIRGVLGD
jgi:haloacetate dehalogenase